MRRFLLILSTAFLLCAFQNVPAQAEKPKIISCDACGQRQIYLAKPVYPKAARFLVRGSVRVEVLIDEKGFVESAKVISGHPFFRAEAVKAALKSKFQPYQTSGKPIKARGIIVYNFIPN